MCKPEMILTHSLQKVFPRETPSRAPEHLYGLSGETLSVQIAYRGEGNLRFSVTGADAVLRRVQAVPCRYPCHEQGDGNYLFTTPQDAPDLLLPCDGTVPGSPGGWSSLWVDLQAPEGNHRVTVSMYDGAVPIDQQSVTLEISPTPLPPQTLLHTQWFYADCLADWYHVPVFSEAHWAILEKFFRSYRSHGCNLILTPIFTPPLDTEVGGERTTTQLVEVSLENGQYRFGFSRLDRWIRLCETVGIENLEICHLFTQWGAAAAPKVVGTVDGVEKRLFGWDTPAVGGEYTRFLRSLLPALKSHLQSLGWLDRTWFHISDEPGQEAFEAFAAARASVADLLEDCRVLDTASTYALYEQGLIRIPIVSENDLPGFLPHHPEHLWVYYCTAQWREVPNRFIAMPSARSRILGVLLYYFDLEGFLHWGFNFYNTALSRAHLDPFRDTDAGGVFPSGDPFLVYPGPDGEPLESIRGAVLKEALADLRALRALEDKLGRPSVLNLLESLHGSPLSFTDYPRSAGFFHRLRQEISSKL